MRKKKQKSKNKSIKELKKQESEKLFCLNKELSHRAYRIQIFVEIN